VRRHRPAQVIAPAISEIDKVSGLTSPLTWELPMENVWKLGPLPATDLRSKTPDFSKAPPLTPGLTWAHTVFDSLRLNAWPRHEGQPNRQSPPTDTGLTRPFMVFKSWKSDPLLCTSPLPGLPRFSEAPPLTPLAVHGGSPAMLTELGYAR
jgi:hypothetical protein